MSGILDKIIPIEQAANNEFYFMLLYGPAGSGKTWFAAGAGNVLFVDAESGIKSIRDHPNIFACRVFEPKKYVDILQVVQGIKQGIITCDTLVLDTITEISRRWLVERCRLQNRPEGIPFLQDYRLLTLTLQDLITDLLSLNCHIIVIAHAITEKDEDTKVIETKPYLTDRLLSTFVSLSDIVGYLTSEATGRGAITRELVVLGNKRLQAKNRLGKQNITDPTWAKLIERAK